MNQLIIYIAAAVVASVLICIVIMRLTVLKRLRRDNRDLSLANVRLEQEKQNAEDNLKAAEQRAEHQMKDQMEMLKLTFEKSATELFEKRTRDLNEQNATGMKSIIDPLKEQMESFKREVESAKKQSAEDSTLIKEHIKNLMEQSTSLGQEAEKLANALKDNNKVKGNWGESHLSNILEKAGMERGKDFETQVKIRDLFGKAIKNDDTDEGMIADFVIHLPDEKHVIIDSKVSLDAYMDYVNATTDEQRDEADLRHLESVRAHIRELTEKDYGKYLQRANKETLQYVIMYIPVEGAFQLFFKNHQEEWQKAYDKKIIVTSDLYVITMLKVIQLAWGEYKRNRQFDKILETTRIMMDRVYGFMEDFDSVGDGIRKMAQSYDSARHRMHDGPRSIDASYRALTDMGVAARKQLTADDSTVGE